MPDSSKHRELAHAQWEKSGSDKQTDREREGRREGGRAERKIDVEKERKTLAEQHHVCHGCPLCQASHKQRARLAPLVNVPARYDGEANEILNRQTERTRRGARTKAEKEGK
ncbi:unnamed protein product [Pleuronectes platessa]|uniref:Uncharacterized protein n=1 Tax=Pleuronectes platessa TaxID=8262 RepID=A0A9N7UJ77_PLEPL|nr:unnamed protein product [Pleuronectes platessa]